MFSSTWSRSARKTGRLATVRRSTSRGSDAVRRVCSAHGKHLQHCRKVVPASRAGVPLHGASRFVGCVINAAYHELGLSLSADGGYGKGLAFLIAHLNIGKARKKTAKLS